MRNIAVIDENFDIDLTSTYQLSIQYSSRNFSFAILDTASMKYIAYKCFWFDSPVPRQKQSDHIRNIINSDSYLTRAYKSVYFIYQTPVSVLVPSPLFRKEDPSAYFRFSAVLQPDDKVVYRKVTAIDAFVLFPIPEELMDQVSFMLQNVQFFHQACPLIEDAIPGSRGIPDTAQVFASINAGSADLLVVKNDKLLLFNSFLIKNTEDVVFYILYLYEQFGLSQEESPVILSGYIEMYPGCAELLQQYLKQVIIRKFPKVFTYSDSFGELATHQLLPLLNLSRCE